MIHLCRPVRFQASSEILRGFRYGKRPNLTARHSATAFPATEWRNYVDLSQTLPFGEVFTDNPVIYMGTVKC